MKIEFKTVVEKDGTVIVEHLRDGVIRSRQATKNPLKVIFLYLYLSRIEYDPHIITSVSVTITGIDVPGKN